MGILRFLCWTLTNTFFFSITAQHWAFCHHLYSFFPWLFIWDLPLPAASPLISLCSVSVTAGNSITSEVCRLSYNNNCLRCSSRFMEYIYSFSLTKFAPAFLSFSYSLWLINRSQFHKPPPSSPLPLSPKHPQTLQYLGPQLQFHQTTGFGLNSHKVG